MKPGNVLSYIIKGTFLYFGKLTTLKKKCLRFKQFRCSYGICKEIVKLNSYHALKYLLHASFEDLKT